MRFVKNTTFEKLKNLTVTDFGDYDQKIRPTLKSKTSVTGGFFVHLAKIHFVRIVSEENGYNNMVNPGTPCK
jgi:hypothetical protein